MISDSDHEQDLEICVLTTIKLFNMMNISRLVRISSGVVIEEEKAMNGDDHVEF